MHFLVHKNIIQKNPSRFKNLVNIFILLIAIPVIIIAAISLSLYFLFLWCKAVFLKKEDAQSPDSNYHLDLDLIHNKSIRITLTEDEADIELTELNEAWQEQVYNEETCLYRFRSIPVIPALEDGICCFYYKEQDDGLILQVLPGDSLNRKLLNTSLIFVDYECFVTRLIDEAGPFFLYNDVKNPQVIRGFNKKADIILELIPSDTDRAPTLQI
jgi:uncharacterized protein YpmB